MKISNDIEDRIQLFPVNMHNPHSKYTDNGNRATVLTRMPDDAKTGTLFHCGWTTYARFIDAACEIGMQGRDIIRLQIGQKVPEYQDCSFDHAVREHAAAFERAYWRKVAQIRNDTFCDDFEEWRGGLTAQERHDFDQRHAVDYSVLGLTLIDDDDPFGLLLDDPEDPFRVN